MDPPHGCRPWRPCLLHHPHHHLHHHHHHPLFLCPHHHHHHHALFNSRHRLRPHFAPFPQNPAHAAPPPAAANPLRTHLNPETSGYKEPHFDDPAPLTLQEQGEIGYGEFEEEEDDDPIFVLTDEWKEFFAKSEAKRKLEKQQAKKKGKR